MKVTYELPVDVILGPEYSMYALPYVTAKALFKHGQRIASVIKWPPYECTVREEWIKDTLFHGPVHAGYTYRPAFIGLDGKPIR